MFEWREDMTPAENQMMLRQGPAALGGTQAAAMAAPLASLQLGQRGPAEYYPNDPGLSGVAQVLDTLLKLSGLFGTGLMAKTGYNAAVTGGMGVR